MRWFSVFPLLILKSETCLHRSKLQFHWDFSSPWVWPDADMEITEIFTLQNGTVTILKRHLKSVNLQYYTQVRWDDGTNDWLTSFFHKILKNSLQKSFEFSFIKLQKWKKKKLCPKSIRNYEKKYFWVS